ncbi:unnamed protein product [Ambrosiozyma monospora]|uniref:Unnamed protein product n=1 Tax=Ambrosiozyma monospora TaxID=43982 RepID=A0ACB5SYE7_AMBMO|nr:unnamed protein product [Ambrosiozyma monospora]
MTTSISFTRCPSPSVSDIYTKLANHCDSATFQCHPIDTTKNTQWIKGIRCLKKLKLIVDSLDASLFDTISTTLQSIHLQVRNYDIPSIKLPPSLRSFRFEGRKVPEIINVKELSNFSEATITFFNKPHFESSETWPSYDIFEAVQSSIDDLPSSITKLDLRMAPLCQEPKKQLSLTTLPQLEDLTIEFRMLDHSVSSLPLKNVRVPDAINERLPNTLKSLRISFDWKTPTDLSYFLRNSILPLNSLTELYLMSIGSVGVDDDDAGALNQCVLSSSICSSLEILRIQAFESADLSNFWQSFCLPLQSLSRMDFFIGSDSYLIINEWPPHLNLLTIDFDTTVGVDRSFTDGCSRVELHGISKSSLKYIRLSGCGNITLKCGPDDEIETIIFSYDEEDGVELTKSIDRFEDGILNMPESIDCGNDIKFVVDGEWRLYK